MRRTNLYKATGLPIFFNDDMTIDLNGLDYVDYYEYFLSDLRPQLLNQSLTGDVLVYTSISGVDKKSVYQKKNIGVSLTVVRPVIAGIEFSKTHGIVHEDAPVLLEVAYGRGRLIMQNIESKFEHDIIITPAFKGKKFIVPSGYSYKFVNISKSPLLIIEIGRYDRKPMRNHLDDWGGMVYYVIRKNCNFEVVQNPRYRIVGNYRSLDWSPVLSELNVSENVPIIKQVIRKYKKFNWLFDSNKSSNIIDLIKC